MSDKIVYVSMPQKALNDLEQFQQVQRGILERLGCQACCSGFDIRYDITRRFIVDDKLQILNR